MTVVGPNTDGTSVRDLSNPLAGSVGWTVAGVGGTLTWGVAKGTKDWDVKLMVGNAPVSANNALATAFPATLGTINYGSSTDLWGSVYSSQFFTPANINATGFGIGVAVQTTDGATFSKYLLLSHFGFALPTDAIVLGISATLYCSADSGAGTAAIDHATITIYYMQLSKMVGVQTMQGVSTVQF